MANISIAVGLGIIIIAIIGIVFIVFFRRTDSINDQTIDEIIPKLKKLSRSQLSDIRRQVSRYVNSKSV